jgi:DNA polymerase-3 subunit epsilon
MRILDTLKIESRKCAINQTHINTESVRLFALRSQYNLSRYKTHNAMQDAISTAELFLAQAAYMGDIDTIKLGELII